MLQAFIPSFGLDISELSIKAIQLKKLDNGFYLQAWNNMEIPEGVISEGNIIDEAKFVNILDDLIKKINGKLTTNYTSLCLPETKTFIKLVNVSYKDNNLIKSLENALTQHIPIPLNELSYDWQVVSDNKNKKVAQILVGAAPVKLIEEYTSIVKKVNLKPVALEVEAQSIVNSLFGLGKNKTNSFFEEIKKLKISKKNNKKLNPKTQQEIYTEKSKIIIDL